MTKETQTTCAYKGEGATAWQTEGKGKLVPGKKRINSTLLSLLLLLLLLLIDRISHFSALAGKYSLILRCSNKHYYYYYYHYYCFCVICRYCKVITKQCIPEGWAIFFCVVQDFYQKFRTKPKRCQRRLTLQAVSLNVVELCDTFTTVHSCANVQLSSCLWLFRKRHNQHYFLPVSY